MCFTKWEPTKETRSKGVRPTAGDATVDKADSLLLTDGSGEEE